MTEKTTIYVVIDIETTYKYKAAFDIAWQALDKNGKIYNHGSYLVTDALSMDYPYFREKMGYYFHDTYQHIITPVGMAYVRTVFNEMITDLRNRGHKVILCAYNASFDATHLEATSQKLMGLPFVTQQFDGWLCIWQAWCESAPRHYSYMTPKGNPKTSAEYAYRFEFNDPNFVERHMAIHDVIIEGRLLTEKVLPRKKKRPIVKDIKNVASQPWRVLKGYPAFQNKTGIMVAA